MKIIIKTLIFLFISVLSAFSMPIVNRGHIMVVERDNGYSIFIKKYLGIESVMLIDSPKDPTYKKTNYALRSEVYNPINGDEKRILNGKELSTKYDSFFIVDSSVEFVSGFGECFHLFIPEKVVWGYDWSDNGYLKVKPGVLLTLRMFQKKFADYTGNFKDLKFTLRVDRIEKEQRDKPNIEETISDKLKPDSSSDSISILNEDDNKKELETADDIKITNDSISDLSVDTIASFDKTTIDPNYQMFSKKILDLLEVINTKLGGVESLGVMTIDTFISAEIIQSQIKVLDIAKEINDLTSDLSVKNILLNDCLHLFGKFSPYFSSTKTSNQYVTDLVDLQVKIIDNSSKLSVSENYNFNLEYLYLITNAYNDFVEYYMNYDHIKKELLSIVESEVFGDLLKVLEGFSLLTENEEELFNAVTENINVFDNVNSTFLEKLDNGDSYIEGFSKNIIDMAEQYFEMNQRIKAGDSSEAVLRYFFYADKYYNDAISILKIFISS